MPRQQADLALGRVLFIDAISEIARERASSLLNPEHRQRIADAYHAFTDQPGFCRLANLTQITDNRHSLSIPLCVERPKRRDRGPEEQRTLREFWPDREQEGRGFWQQMDALVETPDGLLCKDDAPNR